MDYKSILQFSSLLGSPEIESETTTFQVVATFNSVDEYLLEKFPTELYLFFASDDIKHDVKQFIYKCSVGILEEGDYNRAISTENEFFQRKKILQFLNANIKKSLFQNEEFPSSKMIWNSLDKEDLTKYTDEQQQLIQEYLNNYRPFSKMTDIFACIKGRLGVLQFGKVSHFDTVDSIKKRTIFGYPVEGTTNIFINHRGGFYK